jgi:hypothetical protein
MTNDTHHKQAMYVTSCGTRVTLTFVYQSLRIVHTTLSLHIWNNLDRCELVVTVYNFYVKNILKREKLTASQHF